LLGIGRDEADWLFRAYNERSTLHDIRDELAESLAAESVPDGFRPVETVHLPVLDGRS
jgi:hypothetical protein